VPPTHTRGWGIDAGVLVDLGVDTDELVVTVVAAKARAAG
jgi:hypothetical protein